MFVLSTASKATVNRFRGDLVVFWNVCDGSPKLLENHAEKQIQDTERSIFQETIAPLKISGRQRILHII